MDNLIKFVNSFVSYLMVMAVIAVVMAVAITIGIKWRKSKDNKEARIALLQASEKETKTEL